MSDHDAPGEDAELRRRLARLDRPVSPDDDAQRRIEARMLAAFDDAAVAGPMAAIGSDPSEPHAERADADPSPVVPLDLVGGDRREVAGGVERSRWPLMAAAAVLVAAGAAALWWGRAEDPESAPIAETPRPTVAELTIDDWCTSELVEIRRLGRLVAVGEGGNDVLQLTVQELELVVSRLVTIPGVADDRLLDGRDRLETVVGTTRVDLTTGASQGARAVADALDSLERELLDLGGGPACGLDGA